MKQDQKIEVNDLVCVNFNNAYHTLCVRAAVLSIPLSTGDSWIFKDEDNGQIHYVSEGCTVTLLSKKHD